MEFLIGVIVIAIIVGIPIYKQIKRGKLKSSYEEALRGTDKQKALFAGRKYYAYCRRGNVLTTYDETAISNDISAMKV